jgi:hypothetical protein
MDYIKSKLKSLIDYIKINYILIIVITLLVYGFPFMDMHTCELPNGDKVKNQKIYTVSLLGKILGSTIMYHTNAGQPDVISDRFWYSPSNWFKRNISIERSGMNLTDYRSDCSYYAIFGNMLSLGNAGDYNLTTDQEFDLPKEHNLIAPYSDDPILPLVKKELLAKNLMPTFLEVKAEMNALNLDSSRVFIKLDNSTLIYEASLVNKNKEDKPRGCDGYFDDCSPVVAVWQSHSTDNGKTWSKPIITKNAKLFVIGKSIKEQPGVAKDKGTLRYIGWF